MMKRALERIGSMGDLRLPAVLILLCAAFLPGFIGSASAYMTDRGNKMNGLGIGVNTIRIEEDFPPHAPVPGTDIFKKKVQICNTGTIPCYIRVYLAISDGETEKVTAFSADSSGKYATRFSAATVTWAPGVCSSVPFAGFLQENAASVSAAAMKRKAFFIFFVC